MWHAQDASFRSSEQRAPEEWASKHGDKNYALEVAQNPTRARMCGFGDKDRRPLAPAAVAKLIVTDKDNRVIPPDSIQVAFFIVLVDLWDETGLQDMNLVRNAVPHGTSARRRVQRAESQPLSQRYKGESVGTPTSAYPPGASESISQQIPTEGSPFSPSREGTNGTTSGKRKRARRTNGSTDDTTANTFEEVPTQPFFGAQEPTLYPAPYAQEFMPFGNFYATPYSTAPLQFTTASTSTAQGSIDPFITDQSNGQAYGSDLNATNETHDPQHDIQTQVYDNNATPSQPIQGNQIDQAQNDEDANTGDRPTLEFARTLIGPLAASAQTINDENDVPGIFFLFQDLSVRTEGTFRLRMRLVNVGGQPAPEPGASQVRTDTSTVLAQVFTDPFIVYSAKKFPGVPQQTPLSQRLLQQGMKIPGRTRGNTKSSGTSRKRRKTQEEDWVAMGRHDDGSNSEDD